ncbi:MAG: FAD-binding oxidoreductase [Chloroflexota bacterium]
MRRWNGWGEENTSYHFPESAANYLESLVGPGQPSPDASLEEALAQAPASRLCQAKEHPLVVTEALERLYHARGQSLPDWVALRSGRIGCYPDGVAYPQNAAEVRQLMAYAAQVGARLVPYGGGTSVVGHINPLPGEAPTLTLSLARLNRLVELDETSRLATVEAGLPGPVLEKLLNERGYTLGHFPQSFELSTVGGWVATRSCGQQSYYYGRIEDLFAGGHVETPQGALDLPTLPASAAGPDLRQMILGSEGRLGVITQAVLRVRRLPEREAFYGVFFRNWEQGMEAVRQIAQERIGISMARLSNAQETDTTLRLSGKDRLVAWAERGLGLLGYEQCGTGSNGGTGSPAFGRSGRCLLIFGLTGSRASTRLAGRQVGEITRAHGGLFTGEVVGKTWRKSRFLTPYLRNTLWERGYALDTLETGVTWARVANMAEALQSAIRQALQEHSQGNERVLVFAHLSHVYRDGASVYVTYLFRRAEDPDETLERWQAMKRAASQALVAHGGTISHQHGVGVDHAPYLPAEKGQLGMRLLRQAAAELDPEGMMNPGKLFEEQGNVD